MALTSSLCVTAVTPTRPTGLLPHRESHLTRSLSTQDGILTQPIPKGEEKTAPGTDFVASKYLKQLDEIQRL